MQKLRSLHLYLGCIFAPLLLFFAISGIWQTLDVQSALLDQLSTIHTSGGLKKKEVVGLNNPFLTIFVLVMTVSFIGTTVLGILMAIKHGRSGRAAYWCLAIGVIVPLGLVTAVIVA